MELPGLAPGPEAPFSTCARFSSSVTVQPESIMWRTWRDAERRRQSRCGGTGPITRLSWLCRCSCAGWTKALQRAGRTRHDCRGLSGGCVQHAASLVHPRPFRCSRCRISLRRKHAPAAAHPRSWRIARRRTSSWKSERFSRTCGRTSPSRHPSRCRHGPVRPPGQGRPREKVPSCRLLSRNRLAHACHPHCLPEPWPKSAAAPINGPCPSWKRRSAARIRRQGSTHVKTGLIG